MSKVLIAGESWTTTSIHTKGFDSFVTSVYEEGAQHFIDALHAAGHTVVFQPNHVAADSFPATPEELSEYDVVVLSDIGANTLLLPSAVFQRGQRRPNRLEALAQWVRDGGSLLMVGGYLSFQGIEAKANFRATPLADVLPVEMEIGDDRQETPQGVHPHSVQAHPTIEGIGSPWPAILGFHRLTPKPGTTVVAEADGFPLLVVGQAGEGKAAAFATDMGPHWLTQEFLAWPGYALLFTQLIEWLAASEDRAEEPLELAARESAS